MLRKNSSGCRQIGFHRGNKEKMANAKSGFPSSGEMHELNWKEGDVQTVDCWINEKVVLRKRVE